jgi:hypothetical protein
MWFLHQSSVHLSENIQSRIVDPEYRRDADTNIELYVFIGFDKEQTTLKISI